MNNLRTVVFTITAASIIAIAPAAYANSVGGGGGGGFGSFGGSSSSGFVNTSLQGGTGGGRGGPTNFSFLGGSETASRYFRKGVKNFEKGNLEESEYAFRGVLRAHGSKPMNALTFHYLTLINFKQGDEVQKKKYEQAYHELAKK